MFCKFDTAQEYCEHLQAWQIPMNEKKIPTKYMKIIMENGAFHVQDSVGMSAEADIHCRSNIIVLSLCLINT